MKSSELNQALQVYAVTDERQRGEELVEIIYQAIRGGATAIQLRRKNELGRTFVQLGLKIREVTRKAGVLFLVNGRVDIALLTDADGVHVGQDDVSCADARRMLGSEKIIGVSAETLAQALTAERDGADYLGVGAVYPTRSKPDAGFTGLEGLKEIAGRVSIPVVGIGGITADNARMVTEAGACGVAVVSAVMSAKDPANATRKLIGAVQST
ncbi:thiamine phosphate synthase [Alicyclobacillus sp. SO9]|uniref:thiamine phosphate synthase n=1 Tax=Alicyclobacillus sp. SO9 TaxID=2665646 RepID=UPI0018E7D2C5|nr:thiamine phosphate synthase [Alicyclobacillus sp. SO9]QQE78028.1 thiamine phosphate synthase [Alicyclobacillus sp. SO9]